MRFLVRCLLFASVSTLAAAATTECRWTSVPPTIDGRGDDPAWRHAMAVDTFAQSWIEGSPRAREGTRVRLLWDRQALYVLAELDDANVTAPARGPDDNSAPDDAFHVLLRPSDAHPGYFDFTLPASGHLRAAFHADASRAQGRSQRPRGEFRAEARVAVQGTLNDASDRDRGWTIEGRIPWSDFNAAGGRPVPGETWRVNLARVNGPGESAERSTAASLTQPDFHRTGEFAALRFVGPDPIAHAAWNNTRLSGSPEGPSGYAVVRAWPRLAVSAPVTLAPAPEGEWTWYVAQRGGGRDGAMTLRRVRSAGDGSESETLLEWDEQAYSLAFHPRFAENGFVYFGMNGPRAGPPRFSRVVRYTVRDGRPDPASRTVLLEWPSDGHNGAALAFGGDGRLFVTSGDGSSHSDVHRVGQNPADLRAKILRIDVDRPSPVKHYSVPPDNPFVDDARFAPEIWAYGLRNPWRLTYDATSGQLWAGENGQDAWEFAHLVRRGANYGWSTYEGGQPFITTRPLGPHPVTPPALRFSHAEFRSLTGGIVYRGRALPELAGAYIFGDFGTGRVWAAKHDGVKLEWTKELVDTPLSVTHVTADAAGELLLADYGSSGGAIEGAGGFYRVTRAPATAPSPPFPRRLSETGLFADTVRHVPAPGVLRYTLNVPGWHDGATGEHFIALPAGGAVELRPNRNGEPPDGTALVQTLTSDGRRLETRVLLKQQNDWAGYSYVWDPAQRDAELADKAGAELASATGTPWRVPSRAECMMCHSREANFALTLNVAQLNHGTQLETWERRGILKMDTAAWERTRRMSGGGGGDRSPRPQPGQRPAAPGPLLPRDPAELPRLVPAPAKDAALEARARSYLAVNCAHCHTQNGGGNSAMSFGWAVPRERMQTIDERPQHGDFGLADARIVAPGAPGRSVLVPRVAMRGPGQMPPVGTRASDAEGLALLVEWIQSLRH